MPWVSAGVHFGGSHVPNGESDKVPVHLKFSTCPVPVRLDPSRDDLQKLGVVVVPVAHFGAIFRVRVRQGEKQLR